MLVCGHSAQTVTLEPGQLSNAVKGWNTPVVLKGLVADWPAVTAPDELDYLHQFGGQQLINVLVGSSTIDGRFFYNEDMSGFNFGRRQSTIAELLAQLSQLAAAGPGPRSSVYMGSTSVDQCLPGFRGHNDLPLDDLEPLISAWLGNQTTVAAHYDAVDNIACCVMGKRRFTLFPPDQIDNLYVGPSDFTPAGQAISLVDFKQPDLVRFPKFKTAMAQAIVAELEPGDALFVPSLWWHHVEALSDVNLLINYWWRQTPRYMGAPMDALRHALLSIKALPQEQRLAWRGIFDHWVFSADEQKLDHIPVSKRGELGDIDEQTARKIRALLLNKLNR